MKDYLLTVDLRRCYVFCCIKKYKIIMFFFDFFINIFNLYSFSLLTSSNRQMKNLLDFGKILLNSLKLE